MEKKPETSEAPVPARPSTDTGAVVDVPLEKHQDADVALKFVEEHEGITFTKEEEQAVLRKIDWVLMPLMFVSYCIQYMDKSVIAQAVIYGLQEDLNLVGQDYSWCS